MTRSNTYLLKSMDGDTDIIPVLQDIYPLDLKHSDVGTPRFPSIGFSELAENSFSYTYLEHPDSRVTTCYCLLAKVVDKEDADNAMLLVLVTLYEDIRMHAMSLNPNSITKTAFNNLRAAIHSSCSSFIAPDSANEHYFLAVGFPSNPHVDAVDTYVVITARIEDFIGDNPSYIIFQAIITPSECYRQILAHYQAEIFDDMDSTRRLFDDAPSQLN